MPYPYKKFRQNPFTSLRVIRRTDRQTDRTKNITSFFGGSNNNSCVSSALHSWDYQLEERWAASNGQEN